MKTLRESLNKTESKILPINQVDHRFRLEQLSFTMDGICVQASLLTSNEQDYTLRGTYSYAGKQFTEYTMQDATGAEFQVVGIVSKTLYYFGRRACSAIIQALGYAIEE